MSRWVDNEVWEQKDAFNRAPRSAITECEPTRRANLRCVWAARVMLRLVLYTGFFVIIIAGLMYFAS